MVENKHNQKDYKTGKIYCIRNIIDDDIYVGSTTQPICKRFACHKQNIKLEAYRNHALYIRMKDKGIENFYIELYENYPCENVEQLRKREGEVIREIGTLNKQVAGRTQKEYCNDNKEYINKRRNEYNKSNSERLQALRQDYYYREENRERILNTKKRWRDKQPTIPCEKCGCYMKRYSLLKHQQTDKCKSYEKLLKEKTP